jgi:hypothetical protein
VFNWSVSDSVDQLPLFVLLATQSRRNTRELAMVESRGRREVAAALGQIGNQLALALWRGEELARSVRREHLCPECTAKLAPALERFVEAPLGRHAPPARLLPLIGSVC